MPQSLGTSPSAWVLTIRCPRPASRAIDDFHVQPEKIARIAVDWFGPTAELSLTARTVQLRYSSSTPPRNLEFWNEQLATVLDCLYLSTRDADGRYRLPRPVRTEIREDYVRRPEAESTR